MNILIVANHYAVCSARYAADAFTRLGHSVKHVGRPMGRDIWGMQVPAEYVWEPNAQLMEYDKLSAWSPDLDLVVVMDSDPTVLNWAGNASYFVAPTVVWGVDNHVRDYRRPDFDHYFLAHKSVSVMPWGLNYGVHPEPSVNVYYPDMTWLPCAYDPIAFPPSPIPWEQRQYDVACLGVMYPQRHMLVDALKRAGLKVAAGMGLVYENYAAIYHNSRVALSVSAAGDLAIRIFEGAGMGCAVLSDPLKDLAYFDNHPIVEYNNVDEAIELARTLQTRPEVGAESVHWAQAHTWDARTQVVIDWLEGRS